MEASGVGAYGFTVIVSPAAFAAFSKLLAMSPGERSLIELTTNRLLEEPLGMSAP